MKPRSQTEIESSFQQQVLASSTSTVGRSTSATQNTAAGLSDGFNGSQPAAMVCPNCGSRLEGRKCKLFCLRPGCGYQVTCAEW